jgi:tetratricopeptide (TPR) repeat protein
VLKIDPDQIDALNMRGEALRRLLRYDEAKQPFQRLTSIPGGQPAGWIGLGRIARSQNDDVTAEHCFLRAQASDPSDITAAYFAAGKQIDSFLSTYPRRHNLGAAELSTLAGVCASDGRIDYAISFYQKALAKDPEYFPARIGLAEVLGTAHHYDESIEILSRLHQEFPGDSKILISLARELSYARRYDDSRQVYLWNSSRNLADMVPRKEMARVAAWSKQMCLSRRDYATIYTPSVDDQLVEELQSSEEGRAALSSVEPFPTGTNTPYSNYERLNYLLQAGRIPEEYRSPVAAALADLSPEYRVQKAAWLESRAKWLSWNKRLIQSEYTYRDLVGFQPGNQEGWFDLAQVQASQELWRESVASYQQLLQLDPLHTLASQAIEGADIAQHPALFSRYTFWDEEGIGRASDMERQYFESGAEFVWNRQTHLRVSADYWLESPSDGPQADAVGTTVNLQTVFNEFWRAMAEWTFKAISIRPTDLRTPVRPNLVSMPGTIFNWRSNMPESTSFITYSGSSKGYSRIMWGSCSTPM